MTIELVLVILLALTYDFVNGMQDAANAIATCVSTRALSPRNAIIMARTLNFLGAMAHTAVAYTIGKGVIQISGHPAAMQIVLAAVIGATVWNLITWYFGLPSSCTHALVGGLLGAGVAAIGYGCIVWAGIRKIVLAMIISPVAGLVAGVLLIAALSWMFRRANPQNATRNFRWLQIVSAAWMSFSHGMNDTQNAMGIMTLGLMSAGFLTEFHVPLWVMVAAALAMGAGTSAGGWRIIKTMGQRLVSLRPVDGFAAEASAGAVIVGMSLMGAPISTTHVISCAIMGTGAARNTTAVRWSIVKRVVGAWILTIPGAAIIGALCWWTRSALILAVS